MVTLNPIEAVRKVKALAAQPLPEEREAKRVDIIMLKFKEEPALIDKAIHRIVHHTHWPFKLTVFDNRPFPSHVENNRNTSRIWNKLIEESTCRYVLVIDSDAFVPPDLSPCWLTRMMESIHHTGFVIPVSSSSGGAHQHVTGPKPYPSTETNKDIWSGFCFLMDREAYKKVGCFDPRFYIYGQDSEFAFRVGKHGGAIMRSDVFVEHVGGASFKQDPDREADKIHARKLFEYLTKEK